VPVLPCDLHARFTGVLQRASRERGAKLELSSKKVTLLPLPHSFTSFFYPSSKMARRFLPSIAALEPGPLRGAVRFQLRVGEVRTSFDLVMSINDSKFESVRHSVMYTTSTATYNCNTHNKKQWAYVCLVKPRQGRRLNKAPALVTRLAMHKMPAPGRLP
jgi:hypothetical protein